MLFFHSHCLLRPFLLFISVACWDLSVICQWHQMTNPDLFNVRLIILSSDPIRWSENRMATGRTGGQTWQQQNWSNPIESLCSSNWPFSESRTNSINKTRYFDYAFVKQFHRLLLNSKFWLSCNHFGSYKKSSEVQTMNFSWRRYISFQNKMMKYTQAKWMNMDNFMTPEILCWWQLPSLQICTPLHS